MKLIDLPAPSGVSHRHLSFAEVKQAAVKRWPEIYQSAGITFPDSAFKGGSYCPYCGGKEKLDADRFQAKDFDTTGGGVCRKRCGVGGDGFNIIGKIKGWSRKETLRYVAQTLGLWTSQSKPKTTAPETVLTEPDDFPACEKCGCRDTYRSKMKAPLAPDNEWKCAECEPREFKWPASKRLYDFRGPSAKEFDAKRLQQLIGMYCGSKGISKPESLMKLGATLASRNGYDVIRLPMYGPDGKQCSYFDVGPYKDSKLPKGMCGKGTVPGVFKVEGPLNNRVPTLMGEGAKDIAELIGMGYQAVGLPSSSLPKSFVKDASLFAGLDIVLVPDLDEASFAGVERTARALAEVAGSIRVARLPGDITESNGLDVRDCIRLLGADALREAISNAVPWSGSDEASESDGEKVNETADDPHRLARINLELYRTGFGREVKYWNESWYLWKEGQYVEVTHDHFVARLNQSIKQEFDRVWAREDAEYRVWKKSERYNEAKDKGPPSARKVTSGLVRNVVDATRSQCFVSSAVQMHSWIDGRGDGGDTFVSVGNGMLNISGRLRGEKASDTVLSPHVPAWFSTALRI